MDILITDKTRTREILPFLTTGNLKEVLEKVPHVELDTPITEMTIDEFLELIDSPEAYLNVLARKNRKALVFLGKCRTLYKSLDGFSNFLKRFDYKQSAEEKQASNGVPFPSFGNRMAATLIGFYHLHSVEDAGKMKVKEFMLAFEIEGSQTLFSRRYNEIITKKNKLKK